MLEKLLRITRHEHERSNNSMKKKKLLLLFLIISFIWIYGTNYILQEFIPSELNQVVERSKELLYVIVTGWFLYFFITKTEELNAAKLEEQRLSTLINSMVDFVNFKDGEGRWIEANEFGLKLFQLENVDYRGKKDSELAEYTDFYHDALKYCEVSDEEAWKNKGITRVEEIIPLPNGGEKTFDTIKVPLFHNDGSRKGLVVIGRDISERILVEKLLEESRQQYKSLFEYNPDIVYMIDLQGKVINLNPQFKVITGYEASELIGRNIKEVLPSINQEMFVKYFSAVIEEKIPQSFEFEFKHKNGKVLTLQCTFLPIVVNGSIEGITGYAKDVTQLRKTEEQLRRTEKLSVVGELSASVAHEIRNPLTSLKGFVQLLKMEDEKHQLYYKIMSDELDRINHIVGELLLLAKPQQIKFTSANIKGILSDVISLLQTEAVLYNVMIEYTVDESIQPIDCEPNQLKQLFINIIKNAIEASTNGGKVSISLQKMNNEKILITVKDTGIGISKERLERIGEPFYSSKDRGTGLGLTVSFKIVESHNGKIVFNSEAGQGTEVLIELPSTGKISSN